VRAAGIRQRFMRSESDGHCLPATFPGLAVKSAMRRRSLIPVARSLCDRYHPTVDEFLEHVADVRERTGWDTSFRSHRVHRIHAVGEGFELDGKGVFPHVLVAIGHPGLAVPDDLVAEPRAVHAYEPHDYREHVAVVGAGMAAATEWLNALAAGSSVVSVRRREPQRRPLNLDRAMFTRRGLSAFHAMPKDERALVLRNLSAPSYPPGRAWDSPVEEAAASGRFRTAEQPDGVDQVICATGFQRGFRASPLLSGLADDHGLETADAWIVVAPDSTVPALTDDDRTLALSGVSGQWAFPGADTLVGARYAAHRFARRVVRWRTR
jgi:hypothetical protein